MGVKFLYAPPSGGPALKDEAGTLFRVGGLRGVGRSSPLTHGPWDSISNQQTCRGGGTGASLGAPGRTGRGR